MELHRGSNNENRASSHSASDVIALLPALLVNLKSWTETRLVTNKAVHKASGIACHAVNCQILRARCASRSL